MKLLLYKDQPKGGSKERGVLPYLHELSIDPYVK